LVRPRSLLSDLFHQLVLLIPVKNIVELQKKVQIIRHEARNIPGVTSTLMNIPGWLKQTRLFTCTFFALDGPFWLRKRQVSRNNYSDQRDSY